MSGDNNYGTRVYAADADDIAAATPLRRALHAELCRPGALHGDSYAMCERAEAVVRRWIGDGQPVRGDFPVMVSRQGEQR